MAWSYLAGIDIINYLTSDLKVSTLDIEIKPLTINTTSHKNPDLRLKAHAVKLFSLCQRNTDGFSLYVHCSLFIVAAIPKQSNNEYSQALFVLYLTNTFIQYIFTHIFTFV